MSKFVATDLDFNQNEIQNAVEQNLATAPSNPKEGQKYWNTALKKLFIYEWKAMGRILFPLFGTAADFRRAISIKV